MCDKMNQGPIISFLGNLDLERVCPHDSFSKIPTIGDQYFGEDFGGIEDSKQKGVDWYVFRIFSYFFKHTPNFWGIKPLTFFD